MQVIQRQETHGVNVRFTNTPVMLFELLDDDPLDFVMVWEVTRDLDELLLSPLLVLCCVACSFVHPFEVVFSALVILLSHCDACTFVQVWLATVIAFSRSCDVCLFICTCQEGFLCGLFSV